MEQMELERLHENTHLVSHCGHMVLFDIKRDVTVKDRSELTFNRYSFKREESVFLKAGEGSALLGVKPSACVDLVKCQRVTDERRRAATICALVTKKSGKRHVYKYSLLTLCSSDTLECCFGFTLPYKIQERVCILHGPTVLWSHEENVFYTSLLAQGVRQIPLRLAHRVIVELPPHSGQICVVGLQDSDVQTADRTTGYWIEDGKVFDGTMILPHPYVSITLCILVLSARREEGVLLACSAFIATSKQQLVYIENGKIKDICDLPFDNPKNIQLLNTGRNGCLLVVFFQGGHICTIWKETFQIAATWSSVSTFHVDDFLGCGTDQMLLHFEEQCVAGQPLERFLLSDLCGISYSCGLDTEAPRPPPTHENQLLTLQALESRLQSGTTILQELQQEVRVKDRVLQQSVKALMDVISGREPSLTPSEQEGLIALWDTDTEFHNDALDVTTQDVPDESSKPQIDELWHRICEGRLIVGVTLGTNDCLPVSSVSLSILTESGQSTTHAVTQTHSQASWLPEFCSSSSTSSSSSSFSEPAAKRSRQHTANRQDELNTRRLAVTAVTELAPLLNSGCVKCSVMLHYTQKQDAFALASTATPAVLLCGQISLDVYDDFQTQFLANPELKTDQASKDLLCLLAVLDHWDFLIDSPNYSLCDINTWIEKQIGGKKIEVSTQYVLVNSAGPSAPMLVRWYQFSPFQGELSVHSSHSQMLQFLSSLLAFLPPSCTIQAVQGTRDPDTGRAFAVALEKEVMSLKECLSQMLCKEDKKDAKRINSTAHEEIPDTSCLEAVQRCRDGWQQEVERSRCRLSPLVDVGQYRRLVQSMSKVRLNGDLAALLGS